MKEVTPSESLWQPNLLPIVACCVLLLGRTLVIGQGAMTIPLLLTIYVGILAISRQGLALDGRSLFPLTVGVAAVLSARLVLFAPFPWRSTTAGVAVSVLAAVAEEALFRGLLFERLSLRSTKLAIMVSAALFALVHVPFYGPAAFPLDLGAGVLFAWQRTESGNWAVPAGTHALANLLAVL